MRQNLKLSVAIPTYNRGKLLQENLETLLKQVDDISESVEIVVSDNASTDDTQSIVGAYVADKRPIAYYRNIKNLGMDENADLAVRRSRGKFVLLFGDDDMLEPGALATILRCLNNHPEIGMVYMNFRTFDTLLDKEIDFGDAAFDPIKADSYFPDGLEVLKRTRKIFAAISGGVYRRDLWEQANPRKFYGSIFIHVGITLDILCRKSAPAFIFKQPLFKYRLNDSAPGKIKPFQDIFAVSFGLLRILYAHKLYIPGDLFQEMYDKELRWTRKKIIGAKARESVPVADTLRLMRQSYDTSRISFWFFDVPMLLIPRWLLNVPYRLYRMAKYSKV